MEVRRVALIAIVIAATFGCSENKYKYGVIPIHTTEDYLNSYSEESMHMMANLEPRLKNAVFDIRYATANNFTGEIIYEEAGAWAREIVAIRLKRVEDSLKKAGLGLVVFDAYRPYSATVKFYEVYGDTNYVASPYSGSRHNRGCAVDISLYDLNTGEYLVMPTEYDDFTERAHQSTIVDSLSQYNKEYLRGVMTHYGFEAYPFEWWHFDFYLWKHFAILDLTFGELREFHSSYQSIPPNW